MRRNTAIAYCVQRVLNIENVLDHEYFDTGGDRGFIFPGAPRTFLGSVQVEF